jgi:hypothetical protein
MAEASKSPTDISAIAEDPGDQISPQMAGELLIEHFGDVHLARTRLNDAICQNRAATYADGVRVPAHYFAGCMQFTLNATADRFEIRPFAGLHGPNPETGLPYVWTVSRKSVLDLIGGNKQVVADKPGEPVAHHPQRDPGCHGFGAGKASTPLTAPHEHHSEISMSAFKHMGM